jgi:flagellar export protein FliJ
MARFHFPLQPALERVRANEALARRVVVDARLAFDDVCRLLAAVESRLADLRAAAPVAAPGASAGAFAAAEAAKIALDVLRRRRHGEADRARGLLERAREMYARAAAQRGALERLRVRRLAEFNRLKEAAETAEADDATSLRSNASANVSHPSLEEDALGSNEAARSWLRNFPA